jgi:hypothetical protein
MTINHNFNFIPIEKDLNCNLTMALPFWSFFLHLKVSSLLISAGWLLWFLWLLGTVWGVDYAQLIVIVVWYYICYLSMDLTKALSVLTTLEFLLLLPFFLTSTAYLDLWPWYSYRNERPTDPESRWPRHPLALPKQTLPLIPFLASIRGMGRSATPFQPSISSP